MLRLVWATFGKLWQVYKTSVIWLRICLTTTFSFGMISKQQKTHDDGDDLDNYDDNDHDHDLDNYDDDNDDDLDNYDDNDDHDHCTTLPPQTQAEKSPR